MEACASYEVFYSKICIKKRIENPAENNNKSKSLHSKDLFKIERLQPAVFIGVCSLLDWKHYS
eukprot:scaffold28903_cov24-Cyclotella_meneghiniana.AAC.1